MKAIVDAVRTDAPGRRWRQVGHLLLGLAPFIDEVNKDVASWEQVKKWTILPADLTLEAGDLTPSMELERTTVEQRYRSQLDGFHEETTVRL